MLGGLYDAKLWSLLGKSLSYVIKLVPTLWWALPNDPVVPPPKSPNAPTYAQLPETWLAYLTFLAGLTGSCQD
ncbi:hypothetical protein DSO57_1026874 [Entomophthora muscae]|uniref:Uncharacterized protein n=1 Tax=Entomophthora muscae TaxID=34485 RepID=A0ACC2T2E2_9FUNG|nr:hypothetical protein DSO57_1026874 [Entomophthora muscae]